MKKTNLLSIFYVLSDDDCQYWRNYDDMTLSSPNYPKWFGGSCEWLISAQEGFIIALEFTHFYTNELFAYDGTCDHTNQIVELNGLMSNNDKWVISSSGRHIFVRLSGGSLNLFPGFFAKIHYGNETVYD